MSDRQVTVAVAPDDALDDVIRRLRDIGDRPVELVIPADSALLYTASEFRALKDAIDQHRLVVAVRSPDPLRLQLARLFAIDAAPVDLRPRPASPPAAPVAAAAAPGPTRSARVAPPPTQPSLATPGTTEGTNSSELADAAVWWPEPLPPPAPPLAPAPRPPLVIKLPGWRRSRRAQPPSLTSALPPESRDGAGASSSPTGASLGAESDAGQAIAPTTPSLPVAEEASSAPPETAGPGFPGMVAAELSPTVPEATSDQPLSPESSEMEPEGQARGLAVSVRTLLMLGGAALALLLVVGVIAAIRLPRATVSIALKQQPIQAELLFDVTSDGQPFDPSVALTAATRILTTEVIFDGAIATSGRRLEGDQTATGQIELVNTTAAEVVVTAGMVVETVDGVQFAFVEEVHVPAAAGENDGRGRATATIRALAPGTGGNVAIGTVGGELLNGVYANRYMPMTAGTDREISVVSEDDVRALRVQAAAAFPDLARAQLAQPLDDGSVALLSTLTLGEGTGEFDRQAGEDGDTLRLHAVRAVTVMTYHPNDLLPRAKELIQPLLAAQVSPGYQLDTETITFYPATLVEERANGARYRLLAEGRAVAMLDEATVQSLATQLAGADPARAEAILRDHPAIAGFEITYRPAWFPDRMPRDADRITIELVQ